ncbi:mental retardation GTPase activating protein 4 [Tripterygium wilfordii]|uniref:Mental retardation GTPase activating protein 4 n=1 Tax=Tripterygium wilfordii TaxID=458696 RepID=A0A7J7BUN0_TRIWF|nr:VQ motif-containing protein 22-like [Tripterygium wilfordii]KAF5725554.1 mental retardation GTPase activating protein 4 [Tripterygium wilfordii]
MSNNPNDWVQFYPKSIPHATTAVTTTATTTTTTTTSNQFSSSSSGGFGPNLSLEGRVSKPIRRRSRASRRTPTTLLNTDASNFRAMVQQFTGGSTAPFGSAVQHPGVHNIDFELGPRSQAQAHVNDAPPNPMMAPYHMQYQLQQFQRNQPQFMFSGNQDDVFYQRIGNPQPDTPVSEAFVVEEVTSAAAATRPPYYSSNENRSNTFLY